MSKCEASEIKSKPTQLATATVGGHDCRWPRQSIQGVKIKRNLRVKHLLTDGGNTESSSTAGLHLIRDEPYCISREQKLSNVLYVLRSLIGNQIFYLPKDWTDKIPYLDLPTQVASNWDDESLP